MGVALKSITVDQYLSLIGEDLHNRLIENSKGEVFISTEFGETYVALCALTNREKMMSFHRYSKDHNKSSIKEFLEN